LKAAVKVDVKTDETVLIFCTSTIVSIIVVGVAEEFSKALNADCTQKLLREVFVMPSNISCNTPSSPPPNAGAVVIVGAASLEVSQAIGITDDILYGICAYLLIEHLRDALIAAISPQ
jgi:hypothetical protein